MVLVHLETHIRISFKGKALEGLNGNWRIQHPAVLPMIMAENYPEWLSQIVDSSSAIPVRSIHLMSDHISFAAAGVPAISIQSQKHSIHKPEDTAENINKANVEKSLNLAIGILNRLMCQEYK
jgi:Iap family predicted aminopeptidase